MTGTVRYRDGIEVVLSSGETVIADARAPADDVAVVSHAHGDHLYRDPPTAACWSALTRALAAVRRDESTLPAVREHPAIELLPSGHIPGARATFIEDPETGRTYLYTGDVCTRDRFYMDGFAPPEADVLIVESTYGEPGYVFPSFEAELAAFHRWLADYDDVPALCFGYALGRAQELVVACRESDRERVFVSDAIADLNRVIERHLDGLDLDATV